MAIVLPPCSPAYPPYRSPQQFLAGMPKLAIALSSLMVGVLVSWGGGAIAQTRPAAPTPAPSSQASPAEPAPAASPAPTAEVPPTELSSLLTGIDAAANQRDLAAVMQFFSRSFIHGDGLTYRTYQEAVSNFWERFPTLAYQTALNSWSREGTAIVAETTTTVTGTQSLNDRDVTLNATVTSRQRIENGKIVRQEILSERSQLSTGESPPTLDVELPERVAIGREFAFDAIVQEPLGNRLLLGAAMEEPVQARGYQTSPPIELELLSAGGLFKVGRAPALADSRWISAVIIRDDGLTIETRRLRVVNRE
jgi:hypothetical protein